MGSKTTKPVIHVYIIFHPAWLNGCFWRQRSTKDRISKFLKVRQQILQQAVEGLSKYQTRAHIRVGLRGHRGHGRQPAVVRLIEVVPPYSPGLNRRWQELGLNKVRAAADRVMGEVVCELALL